jgi:hypothetical protein
VTKLSGKAPAIDGNISAKICIATDGRVTGVTIIKASAGDAAELQRALMTWHYEPYIDQAGLASPACFGIQFLVKRAN